MKNFKNNLLLIALIAFTFGLSSCGGNSDKHHDEKMENHEAGHDADHMEEHTYACPMHPEITGKEGDKCSKCGMDLKMVDDDNHEGHEH